MSKQLLSPFHTLELEKCPNHFKKGAKDVTVEAVEDGDNTQMIMKPAAPAGGVVDDAAVKGSAAFSASASDIVLVVKIDEEEVLGAAMDAMDKETKGVAMGSEAVDAKADALSADTGMSAESTTTAMANNDRDAGMVNSSMEDVEEPEVTEASVSAGHGAEGAKEAADNVMEVVEEAVEQREQLMSEDGSRDGLEEQMVKMSRPPNSKRFESSAHHKRKSNNVHLLSGFVLLLVMCEATTLPGYSVHSSLRTGSHSHTAAEPWAALQFGNHSIGQYACQGALRPTFIVGLPSCFVFGCGLCLLIRELEKAKAHNQRFVSTGCLMVLEWFALFLAVFFIMLLGFTIACVKTHKDTGIDEAFYIAAFVVVLLLLVSLWMLYRLDELWQVYGSNGKERLGNGKERLAQAGVSVFGVCTGLFVLVMVLRSDHGIRLDQHTTAPIAYSFYAVFLSAVWCIGWALWRRHCSSNAEAIRIKDEECGDNIPLNATGLTQAFSLLFNTYSFAGFSFAPSIPWTNSSSSISFAPAFTPVTQWYSNYVSVLHSLTFTNYLRSIFLCSRLC
jgi:hypothetical protein